MKYVATISMDNWGENKIIRLLRLLDLHEAYLGREVGERGFRHYQCCIDCAGDLERFNREHKLGWHVEHCISWNDSVRYCRKTDNYRYIGDSIEEREYNRIRGRPDNIVGKRIQYHVDTQNDRKISVCVDTTGGTGKSTFGYLNVRRGKYFAVPRTAETPVRIMDYIAMKYNNEPVIWIDLPRTRVVDNDLATILEDIKDGLVTSAKYEGNMRLIRGVKVLVTTNHWVKKETLKLLTRDRWDIFTALPKEDREGDSTR